GIERCPCAGVHALGPRKGFGRLPRSPGRESCQGLHGDAAEGAGLDARPRVAPQGHQAVQPAAQRWRGAQDRRLRADEDAHHTADAIVQPLGGNSLVPRARAPLRRKKVRVCCGHMGGRGGGRRDAGGPTFVSGQE
ncbi:unnamed protein product, partial [Ectocarpus sp. 13 AM-2016]